MCLKTRTYPWINHQVGFDIHGFKVRISKVSISFFYFISLAQVIQRCFSDVYTTENGRKKKTSIQRKVILSISFTFQWLLLHFCFSVTTCFGSQLQNPASTLKCICNQSPQSFVAHLSYQVSQKTPPRMRQYQYKIKMK